MIPGEVSVLFGLDLTIKQFTTHLLIFDPSFNRSPTAPVLTALSEPARSTSDNRATFSPDTPVAASVNVCVRTTLKTAWERDDSLFMFVAATVRDLLPSVIRLSMSYEIRDGVIILMMNSDKNLELNVFRAVTKSSPMAHFPFLSISFPFHLPLFPFPLNTINLFLIS